MIFKNGKRDFVRGFEQNTLFIPFRKFSSIQLFLTVLLQVKVVGNGHVGEHMLDEEIVMMPAISFWPIGNQRAAEL